MPAVDPSHIRNIAIAGHRGTGKTSLTEAILHAAGAISRRGTVEQGSTVADFEEDERSRGHSLNAALCHATWRDREINLIDTPGDPGFHADTIAALRAVEGAIMVVNATTGPEAQHARLWRQCEDDGTGRIVFINAMDRERADFFGAVARLQESYGNAAVAAQLPIGAEDSFEGVIDLLTMKAWHYADGRVSEEPVPEEMLGLAEEYREKLMDGVAENDDTLMEKYLEGEKLSDDELHAAFKAGVIAGTLFPIAAGSAMKGIGIDLLLDMIVDGIPSPVRRAPVPALGDDGEAAALECRADGPLAALVFKTMADPFSGHVNLFRVFAGELKSDSSAFNPVSGARERIGQLFRLQGKEHLPVDALGAGDIGAVAKLKDTATGDSLCDESRPVTFPAIDFPHPVMSFAVEPRSRGDEEKISTALKRLQEEDPSLGVQRDEQTHELIISGISQVHVEVLVERMQRRFGVEVELKPPRVPYQETITRTAQAQGKYKKQTGGRGQYGDCWLEVSPLPRGAGIEFIDKVVGGVIPRGFIPAVEKGVIEAMREGGLAGSPVVDISVTVYDGSHHPVDSSEMAFKIAASMGLKKAISEAGPVLLEPVMSVHVTVPEESVGDIIGDMNSRRGKVLGMESKGRVEQIDAEVPLAEMLSYAPDLRSMTAGQGDFTMEFQRYEEVPDHLASRIVEENTAARV